MRCLSSRTAVVSALVAILAVTAALADHPSVNLGTGPGGPVNTIPGTTLPEGMWSIGLRTEHTDFDTIPDERLSILREERPEADIHSVGSLTSTNLSASYGVSDDLMIGLSLPYIQRRDIREAGHGHGGHGHGMGEEGVVGRARGASHGEGEEEALPEVESLGDVDGIGDLKAFAQYRFFRDDDAGVHAAAILGLEAPTGETNEKSPEGERLEQELQPSSGSWDPLLGTALTRKSGRWQFDGSLLYKIVTEGDQQTDIGDVLSYNAAASYRLFGAEAGHGHAGHGHGGHNHTGLDLVLELNGEWRDEETVAGEVDGNSGGNLLFLSPGVRASGQSWAASVSFGVPVSENLNGIQVDPDWRLIGGVNVSF